VYIIDLTLDERQHGCSKMGCTCKMYTREFFCANEFYISSLPPESFDSERISRISFYIKNSDNTTRINFGSEKDMHRYSLKWSDVKAMEDMLYCDKLLKLSDEEKMQFIPENK